MWSPRRAFYLGLSGLAILGGVLADQTITVDGQDTSIQYTTVSNGDDGATWTTVQRSSDSCDTPQRLTSRLGDYMTFTFTGTGLFVIGTTGVKQGIINFTLDGQNITNFNRGRSELMCDQVLFQELTLPLQQHTVVATLVGRNMNLQTALMDGVLSIQRIRYTIPGSDSSSAPVGAIVGGIIGAVVLIGAGGAGYYFWRRRRHPVKHRKNATFWDHDDLDGGGSKGAGQPTIVATPFEWEGPASRPQQAGGGGGGGGGGAHYGGVEGDQAPGSPTFAATQPLLGSGSPPWSASAHTTSFSGPNSNNISSSSNSNSYNNTLGVPMTGPRTHTSSGSSERRRSGMTASTLVTSNPDPGRGEKNPAMFAMEPIRRYDGPSGAGPAGGGPGMPQPGGPARPMSGSPPVDDTHLVDRIAQRLADIMTERVGVVGGNEAPPPSYVGDEGQSYGSPPPPPPPPPAQETSSRLVTATSSSAPSYPPVTPPSASTTTALSPQYAPSPASVTGLQPSTPPATSTSFGGVATVPGGARFGPRPRPSGSVSGRPGEYAPAAPQRGSSIPKDQWRPESAGSSS